MDSVKSPKQRSLEIDPQVLSKLKSLVRKIDDLCFDNNIPYFFSAAVADDGESTEYYSSVKAAIPMGIELTQNYFENFLKVLKGCETLFPDHIPTMEPLDEKGALEILESV